jgi:iron complex transport system substrate-binding protein
MMLRLALTALFLSSTAAVAEDWPRSFEHRFGTTVLEAPPERVVSLSYQNHDNYLALGIVPVALRFWYGDYPGGVWPWAQPALGDAATVVLTGDINPEQIAALDPDVIEGMWSGMTAEEYAILSQIAPVIAVGAEFGDYATPWDVLIRTTGRITGREDEAQSQLDAISARMAATAADNPDWQGRSVAIASFWEGSVGIGAPEDIRMSLLAALGLTATQAVQDMAEPGAFSVDISPEDLSPIDADVLIWFADSGAGDGIRALPLRPQMRAHIEGREVVADDLLVGAFSHASLLSIPYALDRLVPEITLAIDGDPATAVPSAVAAGFAP